MAGIEPMIVGSSIACRDIWADPALLGALRSGTASADEIAEEVLRRNPPFGNIFRFVAEPCACLGVRLEPGTIVAVDIAAVNGRCPVRSRSAVLTFGKGAHYCLGANSARVQVAAGLRQLVAGRPSLRVDPAAARIDTHNNLKEVRALPYTTRS
jgi:cytochrome P450